MIKDTLFLAICARLTATSGNLYSGADASFVCRAVEHNVLALPDLTGCQGAGGRQLRPATWPEAVGSTIVTNSSLLRRQIIAAVTAAER